MFEVNDDEEYLYTASLFVKESFFNYYDSSDPEIQIWPMETDGIIHPMICSKVFGDKYSARNWLFRLIKTAYSNGARFEDLRLGVLSGLNCNGHKVKRSQADSYWGKFPPQGVKEFMVNDSDMEFSIRLTKFVTQSETLEPRFKLDNLLDSSNLYINQVRGGEYAMKVKGPHEPPFKLDIKMSLDEINKNIENLTSEALNYKEYTIPANSTIDLKTTSYRFVELIEEYNSVVFIFRDGKDYFVLGFDLQKNEWIDDYVVLNPVDRVANPNELVLHKTAVKYLAALILHDFWVTEHIERSKVWNPQRRQPLLNQMPWGKLDLDGKTNIYLPRIKYHYNDLRQQEVKLNDEEVFTVKDGIFQKRFYGRSAHVRDLTKTERSPNPEQVLLANEYGIRVPEGFTFVRPSESSLDEKTREEIAVRNKFYISRSALKSLFNIEMFHDSLIEIKWLKFQHDVIDFCKNSLGLIPLPRKIRKRGDGGIDVLCVQKKSGKFFYWAIQCKCWSRNRPVGTTVLRELFTAGLWTNDLTDDQKKNLRYMIITTSLFSTDENFLDDAANNRIVLIDGESFVKRSIPKDFL